MVSVNQALKGFMVSYFGGVTLKPNPCNGAESLTPYPRLGSLNTQPILEFSKISGTVFWSPKKDPTV